MFKIGDFSKLTMVSVRMLRYYDEVGLFKPAKVDDFTGYRYYSATQITCLNFIIALRDMGFNVADITLIIKEHSEDKIKEILRKKKEQILNNIREDEGRIRKIDATIQDIKKERVTMNYNVNLKSVPSYKVISLRDTIPSYALEGMLWERLDNYMNKKNLACGNIHFAIYHDDSYQEKDVDVEIVMSVEKLLENDEEFTYKETEPIEKVASVLVAGDYSNIAPAFNFIGKWIEENKYSINGSARQFPIKGPWNETNPENYLTEIQIPLR